MTKKVYSAKEIRLKCESDPAFRREIFRKFKRHLENGYSKDCFHELSMHLVEKYIKLYPDDWDVEELAEAERKGKHGWEQIGRKQSDGTCLGNSRSWFYNMANRYKWSERSTAEVEHKGALNVSIINYSRNNPVEDSTKED